MLFCFMTAVHAADSYFELNGFAFDINSEGKATIRDYNGSDTDVTIPDTLLRAPVVAIGNYAFYGSDITSVSFDEATHLESIGVCAFYGCTAMTGVTIPAGVTLSYGSFQSCTALESLTVCDGVAVIPEQCFYGCTSLGEVALPASVTEIGVRAFGECDSLRYVYLTDAVESIAPEAFEGCGQVVIRCEKDSYAAQFAEENGITAEYPCTFMLGDADGDGVITVADATAIQRLFAHLAVDDEGLIALRGNVTGEPLNITDATIIQRYLAQLDIAPYTVGETVTGYTSSEAV